MRTNRFPAISGRLSSHQRGTNSTERVLAQARRLGHGEHARPPACPLDPFVVAEIEGLALVDEHCWPIVVDQIPPQRRSAVGLSDSGAVSETESIETDAASI